ncbi:MAG TPA: hypothetical protein VF267_04700 [Gammaproteobacteria bacterium]
MYRIFRPVCVLACAGLLLGMPAVQAADFVLDAQHRIGTTSGGPAGSSLSDFDAVEPAIAAAPAFNRALIAWSADDPGVVAGNDDDLHLVDDEFEIFARIVSTSFLTNETGHVRISIMGDDRESGDAARERFDANEPAVAWNPVAEEFLVVWAGDDDAAPLVDEEFEIFGQRVNVDGELVGERFRISTMGDDTVADPDLRAAYDAAHPALTVNSETGDYLVTWHGDAGAPLADDEQEVFGRLLGIDGIATGPQFRISFAGADGDASRDATTADVIFNPYSGSYLVAWQADDGNAGLADGEHEVFLQEIDATGALVNAPLQVSSMGPGGDAGYDATRPALAVNPATGDTLVAWQGDTAKGDLVEGELEVFGRVFPAGTGTSGAQARISIMGSDGEQNIATRKAFEGVDPDAAWSETDKRFLVTWSGDTDVELSTDEESDDDSDPLHFVDDEYEIFSRFLRTDGTAAGEQFRVSFHGNDAEDDPEARARYGAHAPAVAFSDGVLLATWSGDADTNGSANNHAEIFAQRIAINTTALALELPDGFDPPTIPEPMRLDFTMTNNGDITARNVKVRIQVVNEFPMTMTGCTVVEDNVCTLGDIPPDGVAEYSVILATDHIQLGDEQSTDLFTTTTADTALEDEGGINGKIFVSAVLSIEGGSGAIGWSWLLLLGLVPLTGAARRRFRD